MSREGTAALAPLALDQSRRRGGVDVKRGRMATPFQIFATYLTAKEKRLESSKSGSHGAHRLDGGGQTALVACSLVLVNDFLVSDAVDRALGSDEHLLSNLLVTAEDRLADSLDGSAQTRTQAHVEGAGLDSLTGALTGLCRIGHLLVILKGMQ